MSARILAVHDQVHRQGQIAQSLEPMHHVSICRDIELAIGLVRDAGQALVDSSPFDLIICSVHVDGNRHFGVFDLLKWIRGSGKMARTPFVLVDLEPSPLARYVIHSIGGAARVLGANGYLIVDRFDSDHFRRQMECYLPEELRTSLAEAQANGNMSLSRVEASDWSTHMRF